MKQAKLTLLRSYLHDRTVGFFAEHPEIKTLERAWADNKVNVSCIRADTYIVTRDTTGRWQFYRVQDIEGRTDIEFHGGVVPRHSAGCILVGMAHDEQFNLIGSDEALEKLLQLYPNGFELTIKTFEGY